MGPRPSRKALAKVQKASKADGAPQAAPEPAPAPAPAPAPPLAEPKQPPAPKAKQPEALKAEPDPGSKAEAREAQQEDATTPSSSETHGQLVQRHKREVKAVRDQVKKLGKKRKEEAGALEQGLEARHRAEVAAWEAAHPQEGADQGPGDEGPPDNLYAFRLDPGGADKAPRQLSKAQKRRAARDAADAEREAEHAAARAAMGESEREREAQALAALLAPLGLALREIPADGHCMYKALEDQLRLGEGPGEGEESPPGGSRLSYLDLRRLAAQHMLAHQAHFLPFVVAEEEEPEAAPEEGETEEAEEGEAGAGPSASVQQPQTPEQRFEAYCRAVEETAAWGGEPELRALAAALPRRIEVLAAAGPPVHIGEGHPGEPLRLCYLRHALGAGEHYNSVVPAIPEEAEETDDEGGEPASDRAAAALKEQLVLGDGHREQPPLAGA